MGGPAWLRHAAALAGQGVETAARLADALRAASVLAPGTMLEFEHPIGRVALDFELATSPPLAVARAAAFCIRGAGRPVVQGIHQMPLTHASDVQRLARRPG